MRLHNFGREFAIETKIAYDSELFKLNRIKRNSRDDVLELYETDSACAKLKLLSSIDSTCDSYR